MEFSGKENLKLLENLNLTANKPIPNLRLHTNAQDSLSPVSKSSLTSRMKRRNQEHKSLDFSLTKCIISTSKYIKANHNILTFPSPPSLTTRKSSATKKNPSPTRHISKSIFLDPFPS